METKSGEIRAISNMKRTASGNYDELYNYALSETSPPGSTFKLASLIALIDDGHVELNTLVETMSVWTYKKNNKVLHTFTEAGNHNYGKIPVKMVFAKSSNVGFAKLAVQYYEKNPQKYFDKLFSMGLLKPLNLQIAGENKIWFTLPDSKIWQPQLLPLSAMGYQITFAPVHTLTLYNAVANNGKMMKPKFVKEIRRHGQIIKTFPDEVIKDKICSNETLEKVREALQGVVDLGTAKRIRDTRFELAGKTGTAQRVLSDTITKKSVFKIKGKRSYQATFAGYIPANDPKYTIVVALYSPLMGEGEEFFGGTYAAPVFKEIAEKLYITDVNWNKTVERNNDSLLLPAEKNTETRQIKNIASKLGLPVDSNTKNDEWVTITKANAKLTTSKIEIAEKKVPSVINMGLRDATYLLENAGLKVSASGKGKVKKQSINAGASVIDGETVFLELEI
jgi:cell division protein FtsI (penicillin-binding protein 3)